MVELGDVFDHIYCINLDRRTDRWADSVEEFAKHGITGVERFSGVDGTLLTPEQNPLGIRRGDAGAFLTHQKLFTDAIQNNYDNFLLLEDDVQFVENFPERFDAAYREVPEWDILYFGGNNTMGIPRRISECVSICDRTLTTHAVAFKRRTYEPFLSAIDITVPADLTYAHMLQFYNSFIFTPPLAWQRPSWSDVEENQVEHLHLR